MKLWDLPSGSRVRASPAPFHTTNFLFAILLVISSYGFIRSDFQLDFPVEIIKKGME